MKLWAIVHGSEGLTIWGTEIEAASENPWEIVECNAVSDVIGESDEERRLRINLR